METNCSDLSNAQIQKCYALGSNIRLPRLPSVPVKAIAVAVSNGDHFAQLNTVFLRGCENWDREGQ